MQQTFVKTIQSHEVEFNRLLYPTRYKVVVRIDNKNPITCTVNKQGSSWDMTIESECPEWLSNMKQDILSAVSGNEMQ